MKVLINPGHTLTGPGSGAVGVLNESKEARDIANIVIRELRAHGVNAVLDRVDKASSQKECLSKIVAMANRMDIDYFISIHFNSSSNKAANGVETYTYKGRQFTDALEVTKYISDLGFNNRGVKEGTGLYVIRRTNAKSMLIEVCFVDGKDTNVYKNQKEEIGKAIARALWNNVRKVEESKKEGKKDMINKLVVYAGDIDANVALLIAQKHKCAMIKESDFKAMNVDVKELIKVGTGENRYDSAKKAVEKYL